MVYVILLLFVLTLFMFLKNFKSKSTYFFVTMMAGLEIAIFAAIVIIAKYGQYPYPQRAIYMPDYLLYLKMGQIKIKYYSLLGLLNVGTMIYVSIVPIFVLEYHRPFDYGIQAKKVMLFPCILVLPAFYLWFYSGETGYMFYLKILELENNGQEDWLWGFLKFTDIFHYVWISIYLFFPIVLLLWWCKKSTIPIKRMQYITMAGCLVALDGLYVALFFKSPFKIVYFLSNEHLLLGRSSKIVISDAYYTMLPLIVLIMVAVTIAMLVKYRGVDTVDFIKRYFLRKSINKLNQNMRGVFHMFKNTLFTMNILVKQLRMENPMLQGETIEDLEDFVQNSLNNMTVMLDACKSINMNVEKYSLYSVLDSVMEQASLPSDITFQKSYLCADIDILMDRFHLIHALLNVCNNAVDAVQARGASDGRIELIMRCEQEWVVLEFKDNGIGMDKKTRKNIYKEFYTTKSRQSNWGVGMSYTYRVIHKHMGFISIKSRIMEGTTVQIVFPRPNQHKSTSVKEKCM